MSLAGNSTSAGAGYQLISTGTLSLAGGNNVTLSQNANALTISAAAQSVQTQSNIQGVIASGSTNLTGNISFANSNGVTFGLSNNTITASVAGGAQSAQTIGGYANGNTTGQLSSSTFDARSVSFSALGGVSAGFSGGMLQMSAPAVSSLSQTGIVNISRNGNTISIGAPAFSAGISTLGNTAGTAGTVSNQIIFAGGNNITLSQSTGSGGNTLSIIGGSPTASINFSAGTTSSNLASISFANSNGVSFGLNGSIMTRTVATNYAASSHTHDDRYYTETEVDALVAFPQVEKLALTSRANTSPFVSIPVGAASLTDGLTGTVSGHAWVCPAAGVYRIEAYLGFQAKASSNGVRAVWICVNAGATSHANTTAPGGGVSKQTVVPSGSGLAIEISAMTTVRLAASDQVMIVARNTDTDNTLTAGSTLTLVREKV